MSSKVLSVHQGREQYMERPIALPRTLISEARSLVTVGCRYKVTRCLEPKTGLRTSNYDDVQREETLSGGTMELFTPRATLMSTNIQPGDELHVHEIDTDHGFIHVTLIIGQSRHEISRVIPLHELDANPDLFLVMPLPAEDVIPVIPSIRSGKAEHVSAVAATPSCRRALSISETVSMPG